MPLQGHTRNETQVAKPVPRQYYQYTRDVSIYNWIPHIEREEVPGVEPGALGIGFRKLPLDHGHPSGGHFMYLLVAIFVSGF
mgnify:CR=1 FL=1